MATKRKAHRDDWGSTRRLNSGRYQARYTGPDGVMHSLGTFTTRTDARGALARARAEIMGGRWSDPTRGTISLGDFLGTWLAGRGDLRPRTRALYLRLLHEWIAADHEIPGGRHGRVVNLGSLPVSAVSAADVRQWHHAVTTKSAARAEARHARAATSTAAVNRAIRAWAAGQGLAVAATGRIPGHLRSAWETAGGAALLLRPDPPVSSGLTEPAQAYRLLSSAMAVAVEEGVVTHNPCTIRNAGSVKVAERVPATPRELQQIADRMPARYSAAVWVAALSGLRHGELFALQRKHVDLGTGRLRVEQALELAGGPRRFGPPKSRASLRTVTIHGRALEALAAHVATYTGPGDDALVFATGSGNVVSAGHISKVFTRARRAAGRPDLRWHDLRHTGATMATQAGATFKEVQYRIGHSTPGAAILYQHLTPGRDELVAREMDRAVRAELTLGA